MSDTSRSPGVRFPSAAGTPLLALLFTQPTLQPTYRAFQLRSAFAHTSTLARSSSRSPHCFRFTVGHSLHLYSLSLNPTQLCNSPSHILVIKAFEVLVDEISDQNRFKNVFRSSSELQLQGLVSISCSISRLASESVTVIDPIWAVYFSSSSRKHTYMHVFTVHNPEVG